MLRIALAVAAGYLAMTALVIATQVTLLRFFIHPSLELDLPPVYLLANGVISLFAAVIGGTITSAIAKKYEAPTILGALMLGIAIGGVVMNRSGEPRWYAALVPLLGSVAATIAGYHFLGREGIAPEKRR